MGHEQPHQYPLNLEPAAPPAELAPEPVEDLPGTDKEVGDLRPGDFSVNHEQRIVRIIPEATRVGIELEKSGIIYLDRDDTLRVERPN
jgi:hypothetical protein